MKKLRFLFLLIFSWISVFVSGQSTIPKMKISKETNASPMVLQELHTDIYVVGQTAVTTMEMVFYNPNNRVMEGEFEFPLSKGQEVSRFALDINGKLREGVVVEKAKGRTAFEAIVRRGIDPGLLEKTEANNFKARVYPMPAKGTRRVLIAFEQELGEKNGQDFYYLPIKDTHRLKKFSLKAEILSRKVVLEGQNSLGLDFKNWKNSYIAEVSKSDYVLSENIEMLFPKIEKPQVFTAPKDNKTYFYANVFTKDKEFTPIKKQFPKKIQILWDVSTSGKNRDLDKEYKFLDQYFNTIKNVEVIVKTFNIKSSSAKRILVKNGNWSELKSFLQGMVYDGATDINAIVFDKNIDEYLLFTDGIFNFGKEQEFSHWTKKISGQVYTINSNKIANFDKLKYLAFHTGGGFIDLNQDNEEKSLQKILYNPYKLIGVKVKSGNVEEVYPNAGEVLDGYLGISGKLISDNADLELSFGYGNKVMKTEVISLLKPQNIDDKEYALLRRIWAHKKMEALKLQGKAPKKIDILGQEYGIVTEGTSLIVLEEVIDYVRYRILPPSELRKEYFALLSKEEEKEKQDKKTKESHKAEHLKNIIQLSKEQTKWWNTNYPLFPKKDKKGKVNERVLESRASLEEVVAEVAGVPNPAPLSQSQRAYAVRGSANKESETPIPVKDIQIQLGEWKPDTPYAKVLEYADIEKSYETYLKLKEEYGQLPSFYVDAANYFFKKDKKEIAVLVISNLAELDLENIQSMRILGYKLLEYHHNEDAINIFRKILKNKEEEPQSYRDLGLALAQNKKYDEAVRMLYEVVENEWDGRFSGVQLIAMNEINNILNHHKNTDKSFINKELIKNEPVDIRVVLTWDTDNADMDLWVTDPEGEKCMYSNKLTRLGGKMSNDLTQGYGPEEFMMKNAVNGKYKIQVNYYGNHSQKQLFPVSLKIEFFTHYGKPEQKKQEVVVRLSDNKETIDVGEFVY